jgi:hypothetical protein
MQQFFSRPEIQSAVLPFAVALLAYLGLRKLTALLAYLGLRKLTAAAWLWALFAAFLLSAGLINGVTFTPLTGTRKIILLVIASLPIAALLPTVLQGRNLQRGVLALLCLLALSWVFSTVASRMQPGAVALLAAGCAALVACLTLSFERIAGNTAKLHSAGLGLLLGTGLSATAAASALLGQLALALAAACGGAFLGWVLAGGTHAGNQGRKSISTLPYVLASASLGVAAVMFASLPWYALIPLAAIPFAVSLVPTNFDSRFLRALLTSLPGLAIAIGVAFWVWQSSGSDSGY